MKKIVYVILCLIFGIIGVLYSQTPTLKEEPFEEPFMVQTIEKRPISFSLGLNTDGGSEAVIKNIPKEIRHVKGLAYNTFIQQDQMGLSLDEGLSVSSRIYFYEIFYLGCGFKVLNGFAFKPDRVEEGKSGTGSEVLWYNLETKEKFAPHFCVGWEQKLTGKSKFKIFGEYTLGGKGTVRATSGVTGWPQERIFASYDIGRYRYQLLRAGFLVDEKEGACRLWIYTGWSFNKISFFEPFKDIKTSTNLPVFGFRIDVLL